MNVLISALHLDANIRAIKAAEAVRAMMTTHESAVRNLFTLVSPV
jgi:hypothetical protein